MQASREELKSANEELQTINYELQVKMAELSQANDDMRNLLNSTDIATLFLDDELKVRRFTTPTTRIIKLIPSDTGRPITDLVTELDYPELVEDAREVLRSLLFHERQVAARGGRWFMVRIMPYRTQDYRIDGLVITFIDISVVKRTEEALCASNTFNEALLRAIPFPMDIVDAQGQILFMSAQMEQSVGRRVVGERCWTRCWTLYNDDRQQCVNCPLKQPIRVGETFSIETAGMLGGRVYKIFYTGMIYQGKESLLEIFLDITEYKRIEKAL